jgi:Ras-related protein Rab-5C/Ras-related protein Rab-22
MTARKIMLLGEIGVGKSSIVQRLVFDRFDMEYKPTIGVDIYRYELPATPRRGPMSLIVWDTDGNLSDLMFRHIYMRAASAAMIIGDLTRRDTLDTMVRLAQGFADELPGRYTGFLLNKHDLVERLDAREIPKSIQDRGTQARLTSARTGENVEAAFSEVGDAILRRGQ